MKLFLTQFKEISKLTIMRFKFALFLVIYLDELNCLLIIGFIVRTNIIIRRNNVNTKV